MGKLFYMLNIYLAQGGNISVMAKTVLRKAI